MPIFRCEILGENFPGLILGEPDPIGFYTTRFIDAPSAAEAEQTALAMLRDAPQLQVPQEARSDNARVFFEQIEEQTKGEVPGVNTGFVFFRMGT